MTETHTSLADHVLLCPQTQLAQWQNQLTLSLLEELKARSDARLLSEPSVAGEITQRILLIAQCLPQEPLAVPLACWARGNWAVYHDPHAAVALYQQALAGYRTTQNPQLIVRLLSNLIAAALQCGQFEIANAAYEHSLPLFSQLNSADQIYLVYINFNYGLLLHYQGRFHDALTLHEQAHTLALYHQKADVVVGTLVNRALTLGMMGRLPEAEAILHQTRPLAIQYTQWLTVARIDMNLGELYIAQGRPAEALRSLQSARKQFESLGNHMEVGSVLLLEANLLTAIGALPDARRSYTQAVAQFTDLKMLPEMGKALTQNAVVSRRYGEYREAARLLDEADKLWQTLDQPIWHIVVQQERIALALALGNLSTAHALLALAAGPQETELLAARRTLLASQVAVHEWQTTGQHIWQETARQAFVDVLAYAQGQGERWLQRQALVGLGTLCQPTDAPAARRFWEEALQIDVSMRQALSVEELKASFLRQHDDLLPRLALCAVQENQPWQALHYLWRAKGDALLDLLQAAQTQSATCAPDDLALQHEVEIVRQELAHQRWQALQRPTDNLSEAGYEFSDPAIRRLEQRLSALRRQRNRVSASDGVDWRLEPDQLLPQFNADVLLEYLVCGDHLLLVRVDSATSAAPARTTRCQTFWLGEWDAVLDLLDELQLIMQTVLLQLSPQPGNFTDEDLDECRALLQRCYALLIAPVQPLPAGARLLIAPCDALHLFPFAAFWDGAQFLVERYVIELTPTAAVGAMPPVAAATTAPLVIGASAEGKLGAVQAEAAAILAAWPASLCQIDDAASIAYLTQVTAAPRILHLASHTVLRADTPLFSALQLAGGLLSVEHCYDLPLQGVELVTLSGCQTASGMDTGGALLALQSAFFVAGAHRVLTSLWPIADQATVQWMRHFYTCLATGVTPETALRYT